MPNIAVLDNKIVTTDDIYKFNLSKTSKFICFHCDKPLHFRQSRNADNNFTEHFYHPNTIKDTHIECENTTLERFINNDTWHNKISAFLDQENREVIRQRDDGTKHVVDAYDSLNNMGIEFQNSPISVEAIQSRDTTTNLDWIFNVENQYIRKVQIGNRVICEIPHENWEKAVKVVKNNVYLYTGCKEWIWLDDRESYHIEVENKKRNVWIGRPYTFQQLYNDSILQNILSEEGATYFLNITKEIEPTKIIYGRCKKSMYLLDEIHRRYVNKHIFKSNEILAIKSVAGSGKTTTLLELAKKHNTKNILYLAFNKALIKDIQVKIKNQNINNLHPYTFHSLAYGAYVDKEKREPQMKELKPQNIQEIIPWFKGKPFAIRKFYVDMYNGFCGNHVIQTTEKYALIKRRKEESLLNTLWRKTMNGEFITFDGLLKLSLNKRLLQGYIDNKYDMIMIDETQDFDMIMLSMLLNDTTIPKIFVGDPKQSIYQFRGCINGFDYLPQSSLIIEFYSTFRVGDPACEQIRQKFEDCWMISKNSNNTILSKNLTMINNSKYTYLFRKWRTLLEKAQVMKNIWINNYEKQVDEMRRLHTLLSKFGGSIDEEEFSDDLPKFLKSLTRDALENIISSIEKNITTVDIAQYKFYTIHSYKGLEDDNIRIANDIDRIEEEDDNLYYVALTRGKKIIIEDITE